ncbi:uncharacterized protein C20orf96-like [Anneissia japonica]|uniref:uncharacterized protein C20orf96-like n=1 Tax=Anneissia japonica TaxID=1529436 RepID=UPI00142568C9|nr:uncharacterized protein C20orf96-like [Anneissia japonica]XP_033104639.1 uncharacterized protein C20orf96-like [Anneissia japonica]XP_033104647.1 uncharacterized protein C20orf96-like [Anneissia japonica]
MTSREDEAILKSLGAIDIKPVDYDQWKRKERKKRVQKILNTTPSSRLLPDVPFNSSIQVKSGHRFGMPSSSSVCNHSHKRIEPPSGPSDDEAIAQRHREIKVLELLIKSRKQAVGNYKCRQEVLLNENEKLRTEIEGAEEATHKDVKQLLQKYERYRGAVSTLTSKFDVEKAKAVKELETTQQEVNVGLKGLEKQLTEVKLLLKDRRAELSVLLSYKDKEYPVKAMKISALRKQVEQLAKDFEAEQVDLESVIAIEQEKYEVKGQEAIEDIKAEVTENAISSMHESLKDMALQNMVMKKEIEEHQQTLVKLEGDNEKLKEEVDSLKVSPEISVRQQLFPHLYRTLPKCTPDMEVVLDIPVQEWLSI